MCYKEPTREIMGLDRLLFRNGFTQHGPVGDDRMQLKREPENNLHVLASFTPEQFILRVYTLAGQVLDAVKETEDKPEDELVKDINHLLESHGLTALN